MKIFRVIYEEDGTTHKEDGKNVTDVRRVDVRYAAATMRQVWDAIEHIRNDPEKTLIAIVEESPQVTVLADEIRRG